MEVHLNSFLSLYSPFFSFFLLCLIITYRYFTYLAIAVQLLFYGVCCKRKQRKPTLHKPRGFLGLCRHFQNVFLIVTLCGKRNKKKFLPNVLLSRGTSSNSSVEHAKISSHCINLGKHVRTVVILKNVY